MFGCEPLVWICNLADGLDLQSRPTARHEHPPGRENQTNGSQPNIRYNRKHDYQR
jgi:hypothetical protein